MAVYNAASSNALLKTYVWGLDLSGSRQGAGGVGGLLGVKEHSGTHAGTYSFAYNANGNVTEVLKKNPGSLLAGSLVAHYEYDPFGNTIRSTGTYANANPFRFSTKYWDAETALYYYGYRYYDPTTGRWPSRDPIEEDGGLNLYAMAGNNLVSRYDVYGLFFSRSSIPLPRLRGCYELKITYLSHRTEIIKKPFLISKSRVRSEVTKIVKDFFPINESNGDCTGCCVNPLDVDRNFTTPSITQTRSIPLLGSITVSVSVTVNIKAKVDICVSIN